MNQKIKSREELRWIVNDLRQRGKKIVTTNGTFDILHTAHLRLLQKAKSLGDVLIVLINSDASVKKFKGEKRPIITENERAEHLAHLSSTDYIAIFDEDNPLKLLKDLRPNFHVKGGSFIPERIKEEKKLLEPWKGELKVFDLEEGYSTTNIISKILEAYKNEKI